MIHIICNNANSKKDGIGDYSYNLYLSFLRVEDLEVCIHSADSGTKGKIDQLSSMKMSKLFEQVSNQIRPRDIVIIEYPFKECNVLIVRSLKKLRDTISRQRGYLVLSLHEYGRVNFLRKYIIKQFIVSSDVVLVTDKHTKTIIEREFAKPVFLRTIPSNIFENPIEGIEKNRKVYIYFGLITKAKAIDNMLQAWKKFNVNNQNTLYFLTSSSFTNDYEQDGVKFLANLEKKDVVRYFCMAGFCVLPIIPCVSAINASYKTALLYGCVPIGHFDEEISQEEFCINVDGTSVDDFLHGYHIAQSLGDSEYKRKVSIIESMPHPTFENTVKEYMEAIDHLINKVA
jgi:hypothetical protein